VLAAAWLGASPSEYWRTSGTHAAAAIAAAMPIVARAVAERLALRARVASRSSV
jgi:hypothetical protein